MVDVEKLKRKREALKAKLTSNIKYFDEIEKNFKSYEEVKQKTVLIEVGLRLESSFSNFEGVQDEIESITDNFDGELEEREQFEVSFFKHISIVHQFLNEINEAKSEVNTDNLSEKSVVNNGQGNEVSACIRLPQINLPSFSGQFELWLEFRDTFQSLIHNNTQLGDVQKFHYLRAALQGNAAQVVHSIELTEANYQVAWQLLGERYNNQSLLINTHIKQLFNLPVITKETAVDFRAFLDQLSKGLRSLEILEQPVSHWDTLLIYLITTKFDKYTLKEWEAKRKDTPTLDDMKEFLRNKAELLETLEFNHKEKSQYKPVLKSKLFNVANKSGCYMCKGEHSIYNCEEFLKLDISQRKEAVSSRKLCMKCLRKGHFARDCMSNDCRKCGNAHNTLLHEEKVSKNKKETNTDRPDEARKSKVFNSTSTFEEVSQVLLPTALVQIADANKQWRTCRALLDCGAQSNFITRYLCEKLKLKTKKINVVVAGIDQTESRIDQQCKVRIQSLHYAFNVDTVCLVVDQINNEIPNTAVKTSNYTVPKHLRLADPGYNKVSPIDLIIGAGIFWDTLLVGQHKLGERAPIMQKTRLGWVISGISYQYPVSQKISCNFAKNEQLYKQLERFWTIEEGPKNRLLTLEEEKCEELFHSTTTRNEEGRFVVQIPIKEESVGLGNSKEIALKRFKMLERKLSNNAKLKESYVAFIDEYENMNHMTKIENKPENDELNYLPHHGVINENSSTTKLRVVFDSSQVTDNGYSFNVQMIGKSLQDELLTLTLRFRQHQFVVCADVEKMYRQILVKEEQRKLQCILWRENPEKKIQSYCLNTVTYGTASAPYLAIKCLRQLGIDYQEKSPKAALAILSDFYMDDLMTGAETENEVIEIANQVSNIMKSGCFYLRKWISNSKKILDAVNEEKGKSVLNLGEKESTKTLGLYWSSKEDYLFYKIQVSNNRNQVTKRILLSQVAQIFDPMGLLSPVIILVKIMIQSLWSNRLDWDESVPPDIYEKWRLFVDELPSLNSLKIPRRVIQAKSKDIQIHGFSDASSEAYGACVYLRSVNEEGQIQVNLLLAKSKVAPLKTTTIPRLELCAANLLAKLIDRVIKSLRIEITNYYCWTDSMVCLHWINTNPKILQVFVANRVTQIQNLTNKESWNHVCSKDNPADLVSRGVAPKMLLQNNLWWKGPPWLSQDSGEWPKTKLEIPSIIEETKRKLNLFFGKEEIPMIDFERFSSMRRLQRTVAYCVRFITNSKSQQKLRKRGYLTSDELSHAIEIIVKIHQKEFFKEELKDFIKLNEVQKRSHIIKLDPFLDEKGIIRVGGRLQLSEYSYDKKYPIIIGKSYLSRLLLKQKHEKLGHAGCNLTLATIRDEFWPLGAKHTLKQIIKSCIVCSKVKPAILNPKTGMLPSVRIKPAPPFLHTGVDYAGPLLIRNKSGRGSRLIKSYICLFVCLATKAIHLELSTELSKECFMASLKRFISRRGKPNSIISDNGTNFIAADRELKELSAFLESTQTEFAKELEQEGISWKFIPAYAPHFGGLWQAGIKQVKNHLRKIVGNIHLTYEQLNTVLCQIEAILNSRPLCSLSPDPNDLSALTPGHFLIGRRLVALPDQIYMEVAENRLNNYQLVQKIQQQFWSRWQREYISELQVRTKWNQSTNPLQEGALVLVKGETTPPLQWPLGRIL